VFPKRVTTKDTVKNSLNTNTVEVEKWFEKLWKTYPMKDGKIEAKKHFMASVHTIEDYQLIKKAQKNYLSCPRIAKGFIKNGSTWFHNWKDWIDYKPPEQFSGKDATDDAEAKRLFE